MSSKRNESTKRKHKTLSIQEKVQLLQQLEAGMSVSHLCKFFSVGSSTIYDIKRKKDDLLKFYAERQSKKGVAVRKTMKAGKCSDLELALVEWFEQRKGEGITVTGGMLIEQAKKFHEEFKLKFHCKYSNGWLDKFKNRHGIKLYTIDDEKLVADSEGGDMLTVECTRFLGDQELVIPNESDAAENFIKKFTDFVIKEELHPEQVYNASQTQLLWRQMPEELLSAKVEDDRSCDMQDSNEAIGVFSCSNAAGTHRCKLLVVGKNPKPKAFNGVKIFPIIYKANKQNRVTSEIMMDWFENHFVPEAKIHCSSLGLNEDSKVLLILDDSLAPSNNESLVKDNVHIIFFPADDAIHIEPQHQGVIQRLKYCYRLECLTYFLGVFSERKSTKIFQNEITLKDSTWALARAWENVLELTLQHSWNKLWPSLIYEGGEESEKVVSDMYTDYKRQTINLMLKYTESTNYGLAKNVSYENIDGWIEADDKISPKNSLDDEEVQTAEINVKIEKDCQANIDGSKAEEKMSIEDCVRLTTELMSGLEQQNCITEEDIMCLYRLKANLIAARFEHSKPKPVEASKYTDTMATKKRKRSSLD